MKHFSSKDRIGLMTLMLLVVVLFAVYFGMDKFLSPKSDEHIMQDTLVVKLQQQMDSLIVLKNKASAYKVYPFNPNYLTEYKAYRLGLSADEYDRLTVFRAKDKWINSVADFKQVTGVNDSLLVVISPFFKFPDWVIRQQNNKQQANSFDSNFNEKIEETPQLVIIKDLNTATKEDLMAIRGIGDKLSDRIITYRKKLKGYTYNSQLYEVWYLERTVADEVLKYFKVLEKPVIQRININTATFKEVMHSSPYVDYKLTKQIFDYKYAAGKITSMDVLKNLDSFPIEKFERISLYLTAE